VAPRVILHVDMDAFYASIEQRDHPQLRGVPVVVGGGTNRGVVAAASYESREFGIRSAMPMAEAFRRCPDLVRVAPRMAHYQSVSREIFTVFREFTPLVEGLSLDEAFLDVTSSRRLFGSGDDIARAIKERIHARTGLTASVGVAPNKLVAKIASDLGKPDGLTVVAAGRVHEVLDPLPVSVIPGIGARTLARLHEAGVHTIAELRRAQDHELEPVFGRYTRKTRERAAGVDERPVVASRAEKSISNEQTYETDLSDRRAMERQLLRLAERTASRLRKAALAAGTVQVKIRRSDFETFTRQRRLRPPANGTDPIYAVARELLCEWLNGNPDARIRLLGVGCSSLAPAGQQDLFADGVASRATDFDRAVDEIRDRFGSDSVARARTLDRP
jgi:DNA polymerase-4